MRTGKDKMTKVFCDGCKKEITRDRPGANVLTYKGLKGVDGETMAWDWCEECISKLVETIGQPTSVIHWDNSRSPNKRPLGAANHPHLRGVPTR